MSPVQLPLLPSILLSAPGKDFPAAGLCAGGEREFLYVAVIIRGKGKEPVISTKKRWGETKE